MERQVYRYRFARDVSIRQAEETLILSMFAAEGLYGEARVRLDARYVISEERRAIVVDASTVVGLDVNRIFTGLALKEFGADAFRVERIERTAEKETDERPACRNGGAGREAQS